MILGSVGCNSSDSESGPSFDSGNIEPDGNFSYTFENEGTVDYHCAIHPNDMQGSITVSSDAMASGQDTVEMENTSFNPSNLTVQPNTEIVWINSDIVAHTVVSGNPSSDDGGGYY